MDITRTREPIKKAGYCDVKVDGKQVVCYHHRNCIMCSLNELLKLSNLEEEKK